MIDHMLSRRWGALLALLLAMTLPGTALAQGDPDTPPPPGALIWQVNGPPSRPPEAGALLWVTGETRDLLAAVPDEGPGTRVTLCGPAALAEDGSAVIFFAGAERGSLYRLPLDGSGGVIRLGEAHILACAGAGRAMRSTDGTRWAYIDYPPDATRSRPYASGTLRVLALPDGEPGVVVENVVAFTLAGGMAYTVQFFTNAQNMADEAVLTAWDGETEREWASLMPAGGCDWTSAALDVAPESGQLILSLGEHCPGGSQWRLFSLEEGTAPIEQVNMPSGGAFLPASLINHVMFLEGGTQVLATLPNGRAATVANLVLVDLAAHTVTLVTAGVTVDSAPGGMARHLRRSPDGRFLAYVSSTPNNEHFLHRLALDGSYLPVTISAGSRGDVISSFTWRPDGGLVYVAGGVEGQDNSLFLLPPGADAPLRVLRGQFWGAYSAATDTAALLLAYVEPSEDYPAAAARLLQIGFDGAQTLVVDGREATAIPYPLLAR